MNNTTTFEAEWPTHIPRTHIANDCFTFILGTSALVLNSMLLLVLHRDPFNKFRTTMTILVANLAICDALTGLIISIRVACWVWLSYKEYSLTLHVAHEYLYLSRQWAIQCSLVTVMFISWERLFAIAFPIRCKVYVTKTRTFLLCVISWLLSPILIVLGLILTNTFFRVLLVGVDCLNGLMVILIVVGYCCIYRALKRKEQDIGRYDEPAGTPCNTIKRKNLAENRRLTNTFLVITVILLITVVPTITISMIMHYCAVKCVNHDVKLFSRFEPVWLVNFSANPIVYAFQLRVYRQAFLAVFGCKRRLVESRNENTTRQ